MRRPIAFLALLAAALLAGTAGAYPLYLAARTFTDLPFEDAAAHAVALGGVIASLLYLGTSGPWRLADIGLRRPDRASVSAFAACFVLGIGLIAGIELILILLGVHCFDAQQDFGTAALLRRASYAIAAGLAIALFEETLFRGVLYEGIRRSMGAGAAVLLGSAVYAAAHFIKFTPPHPGDAIGWGTAFELLPRALRRFADVSVYDSITAVFLLGVLLARLRRHYGHIAPGAGLHAGVAAMLLMMKYLTDFAPDSRFAFLVSRYDNYQGGLACLWLAAAIAGFAAYARRRTATA